MIKNESGLEELRHTTEHVLTQAMIALYPDLIMAMGPATDDGFYFDFDLNQKITEEDFSKIESEMAKIIARNLPITKEEVTLDQARKIFRKNKYKLGWLNEITNRQEKSLEKITIYSTGKEFLDLCSGPHLKNTGEIKAFKLLSVAGAYWRGSEKNKMLTRIYGTAFFSQKELDEYLNQREEAEKRDHRKLNENLEIYTISDDLGKGLITLLPNGSIIAEELEKWAKETENKRGYVRVFTPHIASDKLFRISGHVPYYTSSMFPPMRMEEKGEGETEIYYLKPMNCAGHHLVFKSKTRSYRDLPLRIAEYGAVYRYEKSGELLGMMRVRGPIHQNDSHIFCTEDQAETEFKNVMDLHKYYYDTLGLKSKDYFLSLAIRDPKNKEKYAGDDETWEKAESIALNFIKKTNIPYEIETGGAAFYGPKIDFNIKTVTGKVFSASTNQLDYFLPKAFGLKYIDKDGIEKKPVCIHRAPLGAHVRFIAFLMEHFAGNFPTWLTPIQVKVLPISEKHLEYAKNIYEKLKDYGIRTELDGRDETLGGKIRDAQMEKVNYMAIVGDNEVKNKTISVRDRKGKNTGEIKIDNFISNIKEEIAKKTIN